MVMVKESVRVVVMVMVMVSVHLVQTFWEVVLEHSRHHSSPREVNILSACNRSVTEVLQKGH
jgi:hypothetical protein